MSTKVYKDGKWLTITDRASQTNASEQYVADSMNTRVAKNTIYFNVKDFGALGDGVNDDTVACQNALDAAKANGGGVVLFPAGLYFINPIYVGKGVSVQGSGAECTTIKRRPASLTNDDSVGPINFWGTSSNRLTNFFVRDITADGNKSAMTDGGGDLVDNEAFSFGYCSDFTVDSCRGINATGEGFDFDYCINGTITNSTATNNGGNGVHFSLSSTLMKAIGNFASGNGYDFSRAGLDQWTSATNCVFVGNIAQSNYINYKIQGSGAVFTGNKSLSGSNADVLTGVA